MASFDPGSVDVPLSLFCGLDTELSPGDVPEGISPDNQDVCFLPSSVFTRPGLEHVFDIVFGDVGPTTYQKSYVAPDGMRRNLYLTISGNLYVENVTNSPGVATLIFTSSAVSASSVTAFGREYIALSDGVHGSDVPIQYDGTNIYRVTQDGPAEPPLVASVALPESTLSASAATPEGITSVTAIIPVVVGGISYYQRLVVLLSGSPAVFNVGQIVTIAGNATAGFNINGTIESISGQTITLVPGASVTTGGTGAGGTLTGPVATLSRSNNTVTANTATPHSFQKGYLALISDVAPTVVGAAITSIVIDNEESPGIATVTMTTPHGLLPGNIINIGPVAPTVVGGHITFVQRSAQIATITMSSAPNVFQGSIVTVQVSTIGNVTFDGQWEVLSINGNSFSYAQVDVDFPQTADSGTGTVSLNWPLANIDPSLNFFTVLTAPSPTVFTVSFSYTNGTWGSGTQVTFGWTGKFYVTAVLSPTSFQYQQYGPSVSTTAAGTATPYGQAAPGIHQVQQAFLLFTGAITEPSPPSTFVANGGQYLSVSNLAIGPVSSVAGRILLFTGAGGAFFFYIPVPAQVNGIQVSTATQINDNTTTGLILDFADSTLYAATACSIPGNNLAEQVVLGPCAGFFTYGSRLQAWGEYNKVQNFLNMGFDGGFITPDTPTGWTVASSGGSIVPARVATAWQIAITSTGTPFGQIFQSAAFDAYGAPILLPNTAYSLRIWVSNDTLASTVTLNATLTSASTGFSSTAAINSFTNAGAFTEEDFSLTMPATIPSDLTLTIWGQSASGTATLVIDEAELIYTDQPYLDTQERLSYIANPEGFDGITGVLGPEDDASPIRNHGVIRNTLYLITGGSLHETSDNGQTEPSGWTVSHVADNCGAWSIASVARNVQGIGSAAKELMAWNGPDGAQVFAGQQPEKISQEIQSEFDLIDDAISQKAWVKNDYIEKRMYFGIPTSVSTMLTLVMDYRNMEGEAIAGSAPVRISYTGRYVASDFARKWTRWNLQMACGEMMYRNATGSPQMCFGGGNLGSSSVTEANTWFLNPVLLQDQNFGQIFSYYTTYFFISHEMEQALQLGSHRHEYLYLTFYAQVVGQIEFTPLMVSLTHPFTALPLMSPGLDPSFDWEMDINVTTTRCAFKIAVIPQEDQTDAYFNIQKLIVNMKKAPIPVRGSNSGSY